MVPYMHLGVFVGDRIPLYPENILFFVIQNRFAGKKGD
jgi:hypothetical protein